MPGHVWDTSKLYTTGDVQLLAIPEPSGDFNLDGILDTRDVDLLVNEIVGGENNKTLDLTGDDIVDAADLSVWLNDAAIANGFTASYLLGDANLDGIVNASDLNALGQNWLGSPNTWQLGDFNADGTVNAGDLNNIGQNWQASIPSAASRANVPEPHPFTMLLLGAIATPLLRHRRWSGFLASSAKDKGLVPPVSHRRMRPSRI